MVDSYEKENKIIVEVCPVAIPTIVRESIDKLYRTIEDRNLYNILQDLNRNAYYIYIAVDNITTSTIENCSISLDFSSFCVELEVGGKSHTVDGGTNTINIGTLRPKEKANIKLWHTDWSVYSRERLLERLKFLSKTHVKTSITTYIWQEFIDSYTFKIRKIMVSSFIEVTAFFLKLFCAVIVIGILMLFLTGKRIVFH